MKKSQKKWLRIVAYFLIATTISSLFRLTRFDWYKDLTLPYGLTNMKYLLEGVGPLIGALIIFILFKNKSSISTVGTSGLKSTIMVAIPIILFSAFGVNNDLQLNKHYYGFIIGLVISIYCFFEESGWRGYLQNELNGTKPIFKYLVIGSLWYSWHLTFIVWNTTFKNELKMLGLFVLLSWGIGQIAEKTRSVIACSCFHLLGSLLGFSPLLSTAFDDKTRYMIFGIALVTFIYIVNTWDKKTLLSTRVLR